MHLPKDPGEIPPLSRAGLHASFGMLALMEPVTDLHLAELAKAELLDVYDSPHAHPWHVSFHASEFPGHAESACERYLAYRMANVVADEPTPAWVSMTGDVGKAGELTIARAWFSGQQLLAIPEDPDMPAALLAKARQLIRDGRIDDAIKEISKPAIRQLGFVSPD